MITKPPFSSFNFFETLFNKTEENNILLLDEKGNIITINKAFTKSFGYSRKELIGKNFAMLFIDEDKKKGRPENEIAGVIKTGQCADNNYLVKKNKKIVWVSGESVMVKNETGANCILKIIQDINQQKKSERSALEFSSFNENILASIDDVVIVLDEKMNILKKNHAFSSLFKNPEAGKQVMNFKELIKPYDPYGILIQQIKNTFKNQKRPAEQTVEIETLAGEKRYFDFKCSQLTHIGEGKNVLLVIHDITAYKQIEKEREDVIGFVSHELRNPLANLMLCNEILNESLKEQNVREAEEMLLRSKNNIKRLNKMIAELYDATRVNSGILKLEIAPFNLREMIREAIETVQVLQPAYKIVAKGETDFEVTGDRYRIIQVVTNFLGNGIKYSNSNKNVTLSVSHNKKSITVSVKDEGQGISPENLDHVFERFFRAEKTRNIEGIGLGLYLCKQIIQAHHGTIWAESKEGKGSAFYFLFRDEIEMNISHR
ncbi:MAG TPA: PAS domain-containing sensor histidine kinase [Hanamia sp.]